MPAVAYPHIEFRSDGVPIITGTRTKVEEIALDHIAYRWNAEQIHVQYPYLTLGQIHSALAYYYDHQAEMDRSMETRERRVEEIRSSLGDSPVREKLKAKRLLQ